jgi:hypothetical protein
MKIPSAITVKQEQTSQQFLSSNDGTFFKEITGIGLNYGSSILLPQESSSPRNLQSSKAITPF